MLTERISLPGQKYASSLSRVFSVGHVYMGGSRANLKEGQSLVGALKIFQKLVTRVRCIQRFSDPFSE